MRSANKIFVVLVIVGLLICLAAAILLPNDINTYENRLAYKMPSPTFRGFVNNEFQNGVELAMTDQFPLSSKFKKAYNLSNTLYITQSVDRYVEANPNKYIKYKSINFFGEDRLLYNPVELENIKGNLDIKIENLNQTFNNNSTVDFYVYFIEKDTDINFETNIKQGLKEYVFDGLQLPDNRKISFDINSIEEFKNYFYSTDHHWNHRGSYKGYCDVITALKPGDKLIEAKREVFIAQGFSGSKNSSLGYHFFSEDFYAYEFDYPEMSIEINGEQATDYGNQKEFFSDARNDITYGAFYGNDDGEIIFEMDSSNDENILIIGESFDNAILKLIATHFNKTCSIDLRYYESVMKKPFNIQSYIMEHEIDKVLLIGNIDYFSSGDFILE